jgi:hypothetical protein
MRYNFCTLFDSNYATRGLALYRSLERHCKNDFLLTILCIDEEVRAALAKLNLPRVRLWRVEDIGDDELLEVRKTRPRREFCWTCPGPLMLALLRNGGSGALVTYLDADLLFYSDPQPIFDELGENEILIHGHRFAPRYQSYAIPSGNFNVGLIAVRNAPEGMACLEHWRAQNMEMCVLDPENGYCGDQKYLDEWPALYKKLVILQHPGAGLAPWNVENYEIGEKDGHATVDGRPVIFYHYHGFRIMVGDKWLRWAALPAVGYDFTPLQRHLLYRPYVRSVRQAYRELARVGLKMPQLSISIRDFIRHCRLRRLVFA